MKTVINLLAAVVTLTTLTFANPASATTSTEMKVVSNADFTITDDASETDAFTANGIDDPIKKKKKKRRRNSWMPVRLFEKGQWDANIAFGTVPTYVMDKAKVLMPPVQAGMNYRISEHFSIGAMIGHSISESQPTTLSNDVSTSQTGIQASWTNNTTFLAIRPGVHITKIENWDFYGGFAIGANFINIDGNSTISDERLQVIESHMGISRRNMNATFSGYTGVRRVVSPKWTVTGEVGSGISLVTLGASYKISKSKTDPN